MCENYIKLYWIKNLTTLMLYGVCFYAVLMFCANAVFMTIDKYRFL